MRKDLNCPVGFENISKIDIGLITEMSTRFFTNESDNTLLKKFAGVFAHNPDIERFDALVGYLRASGYFALRPHLENVPKKVFVEKQNGWYEIQPEGLESFPIPAASAAEQAALSALVDGILAAKRKGDEATVTALESEIDTHVFHLCALTPEEIALVKGSATK